jgi:hypothetical protein
LARQIFGGGCVTTLAAEHALIGYLLTCPGTGAWPGSV